MAVDTNIYGQPGLRYVGCVLSTYERNGYHDSDFYAVCWDEEKQAVVDVEYDTTRAGGGGHAYIDATDEVLRKVYRYYKKMGRSHFDTVYNPKQAQEIRRGDTVTVIRGRKIPKGSVGQVFWVGTRFNQYSRHNEDRVGVEIDGERVFLPLEYVEVNDWQARLLTGRTRKNQIRNFAINSMPRHYQSLFVKCPS